MFDMGKVTEYVCDKYYYVVYKNDNLIEHPINGLLLNYASGNIVLLAEDGIKIILRGVKYERLYL